MKKRASPEIKKEAIFLRIPETLNKKLEKRVSEIGISRPAFILSLIYKEIGEIKTEGRVEKID